MLLLLALLAGPASAQDATEQPLAIPADPGNTRPAVPPSTARPPRQGELSAEKLAALRTYQAERLVIRGETEVHSSPTVWTGYHWGPWWGPRTSITVMPGPAYASRTWGFYQGVDRLSVPAALTLAGDPRGADIQRTIDRKKGAARAWYTVAGIGGGAIVASLFGQIAADNRQEYVNWQLVGLGGATGTVVGLIGGSGPASEARGLDRYPARTLSPTEARQIVDRHNDRLRQELGLTPQEVWSIEKDTPPGPR